MCTIATLGILVTMVPNARPAFLHAAAESELRTMVNLLHVAANCCNGLKQLAMRSRTAGTNEAAVVSAWIFHE